MSPRLSVPPVGTLTPRFKWILSLKLFAHAGNVVHGFSNVRSHAHHGKSVRNPVHKPEHMHLRCHVDGRHHEVGKHLGTAEIVGAVAVPVHFHETVAVGEHPFTRFVVMIAHNSDGGVVIGKRDFVGKRYAAVKPGKNCCRQDEKMGSFPQVRAKR